MIGLILSELDDGDKRCSEARRSLRSEDRIGVPVLRNPEKWALGVHRKL